jgi:DNA-binding NtrC family response regulator
MQEPSTPLPSFLFVDADPRALDALRRLCRHLPGNKRFARGVLEAEALMREAAPSVVVCGYCLPDGDGLCLLTCVRARHPRAACALHTSQPPARALITEGITWVDRGAAPQQVLALLASLG